MKHVSADQLASLTANPSSPPDGALWYRSDTDVLNVQLDGSTRIASVPYVGRSTSTTSIGTTATVVNNLSIANLPIGTWSFTAWIPCTSVGTFTNVTATISPTGSPNVNWMRAQVTVWTTATAAASAILSAFNTASGGTSGATGPVAIIVSGAMDSSTSGTLSIALTRTGGTSVITSIGSYLSATRLA